MPQAMTHGSAESQKGRGKGLCGQRFACLKTDHYILLNWSYLFREHKESASLEMEKQDESDVFEGQREYGQRIQPEHDLLVGSLCNCVTVTLHLKNSTAGQSY